jgi:hypothetical protein
MKEGVPMATENANAVRNAALIAAIELILQPESGNRWLYEEIMAPFGFDVPEDYETDEDFQAVNGELDKILAAAAEPLIAQLPPELAAPYRKR